MRAYTCVSTSPLYYKIVNLLTLVHALVVFDHQGDPLELQWKSQWVLCQSASVLV
jgi:hypothetical protein